jgi:CRP/FNR family transcriptional regulator, cyclic AMP receptor protein
MTNRKAQLDESAPCHVLREDADLASGIQSSRRHRAEDACTAPTLTVGRGTWSYRPAENAHLLVLDGLLLRRVGLEGRFGAELLGAGDLLRPYDADRLEPMLSRTTVWQALEIARLAVLDDRVVQRMARYPGVIERLLGRSIERSRRLSVNLAIVHHPKVDVRIHMLLWHLCERWGSVEDGRMLLPLRLTHDVLADLIAARRPTVSAALSDLTRRRILCRAKKGWLLTSGPRGAA